jgi:hypothetical protein
MHLFKLSQGAQKYFKALDNIIVDSDPVNDWLNSLPIPLSVDSITYWTGMESMGHPLSHMALDFLSIPGMFCIAIT